MGIKHVSFSDRVVVDSAESLVEKSNNYKSNFTIVS